MLLRGVTHSYSKQVNMKLFCRRISAVTVDRTKKERNWVSVRCFFLVGFIFVWDMFLHSWIEEFWLVVLVGLVSCCKIDMSPPKSRQHFQMSIR